MTPGEMEKTITFMLEHQTKFDAEIEKIDETLAKHTDAIGGLIRVSQDLLDHQKAMGTRQAAENQMREIRTEMKGLACAQKGTDQRPNVLIDIVEKYISGHGHGSPSLSCAYRHKPPLTNLNPSSLIVVESRGPLAYIFGPTLTLE
jgi:hypothetical protein